MVLISGGNAGLLTFRNTQDLTCIRTIDLSRHGAIRCMVVAPEQQDIILATGDGALHVVTDPEKRADTVANRLEETFIGM